MPSPPEQYCSLYTSLLCVFTFPVLVSSSTFSDLAFIFPFLLQCVPWEIFLHVFSVSGGPCAAAQPFRIRSQSQSLKTERLAEVLAVCSSCTVSSKHFFPVGNVKKKKKIKKPQTPRLVVSPEIENVNTEQSVMKPGAFPPLFLHGFKYQLNVTTLVFLKGCCVFLQDNVGGSVDISQPRVLL